MSFSAYLIGTPAAVSGTLDPAQTGAADPFQHGGTLGQLTRDYLAAVVKLASPDIGLVIEAIGHAYDEAPAAGSDSINLTVKVTTARWLQDPAAPAQPPTATTKPAGGNQGPFLPAEQPAAAPAAGEVPTG